MAVIAIWVTNDSRVYVHGVCMNTGNCKGAPTICLRHTGLRVSNANSDVGVVLTPSCLANCRANKLTQKLPRIVTSSFALEILRCWRQRPLLDESVGSKQLILHWTAVCGVFWHSLGKEKKKGGEVLRFHC